MSNVGNARSAAQHERVQSTSFGRKGSSSRTPTRDRPPSSSELVPDDSASNVSPQGAVSGGSKVNGVSKPYSEKETRKIQGTTRESLYVRMRSPVKKSFGDGADERIPRGLSPQDGQVAPGTMPGVRKVKKALRKWDGMSGIKAAR